MRSKKCCLAIICIVNAGVIPNASWATEDGTASAPAGAPQQERALQLITPSVTYASASVASAGVGLRNRPGGGIELGFVGKPVRAAFLYWTIISDGPLTGAARNMKIQRVVPTESALLTVAGTIIGQGASPCWGGDRITVLRAAVPTSVVNSQGTYLVRLPPRVAGVVDGSNPWEKHIRPSYNGASLVAIGRGTGSVAIYDGGLAGNTFNAYPGLSYPLAITSTFANASSLKLHQISSDGQDETNGVDGRRIATEITTVNAKRISGPGSDGNDSDWNGSSGKPSAKLWDDTVREISDKVAFGATRLNIRVATGNIAGNFDCVTPVANILSTK